MIDNLGIVGFFLATIGDLGIISLLCDYNWELFGVSLIAPVYTYVSQDPQLLCGYAVDNTPFHRQSMVV